MAGEFVSDVERWQQVRLGNEALPHEREALSLVLADHLFLLANLRERRLAEATLEYAVRAGERYVANAAILMLQHHSPFTDQELTWLDEQRPEDAGAFVDELESHSYAARSLVERYRAWLMTVDSGNARNDWSGESAALSLRAAEELHRVGAPILRAWFEAQDEDQLPHES